MSNKGNLAAGAAKKVIDGFFAGMMISLGGAVFLACNNSETPYSRYIGAVFFSLALVCICLRGYSLYTGKIGLITEKHSADDLSVLILCLIGNILGTVAFGYLIGWVFPNLKEIAQTLCGAKLQQGYGFGLLRALLCGILVYLSVDIYRNNQTTMGILLCIPAFILSGYEHSIADMFYFSAAGICNWETVLYIFMILLGNSLGGLLIPVLQLIHPRENQNDTQN